jgi:hypothetical protein
MHSETFNNSAVTNKQVVDELVQIIFENVAEHVSGNALMLAPAINILKLKIRQMDNADADFIVDAVHRISHQIEMKTGRLSPYHGIEEIANAEAIIPT